MSTMSKKEGFACDVWYVLIGLSPLIRFHRKSSLVSTANCSLRISNHQY